MSLIGNNWKDEPTPEEQYKEATGIQFVGTKDELLKQIEKDINSNYSSKVERNHLRDLNSKIQNQ